MREMFERFSIVEYAEKSFDQKRGYPVIVQVRGRFRTISNCHSRAGPARISLPADIIFTEFSNIYLLFDGKAWKVFSEIDLIDADSV